MILCDVISAPDPQYGALQFYKVREFSEIITKFDFQFVCMTHVHATGKHITCCSMPLPLV